MTYVIQVAGWVKAHTGALRASDLSKPKQLHRLVFHHQHRAREQEDSNQEQKANLDEMLPLHPSLSLLRIRRSTKHTPNQTRGLAWQMQLGLQPIAEFPLLLLPILFVLVDLLFLLFPFFVLSRKVRKEPVLPLLWWLFRFGRGRRTRTSFGFALGLGVEALGGNVCTRRLGDERDGLSEGNGGS